MNRQQVEGVSVQAGAHAEGQRTVPRRRLFLWLLAVALLGGGIGALGMRYVGVLHEAIWAPDAKEAGRGESASASHDVKRLVPLTDNQIKQFGIEVAVAQAGRLLRHRTLPGTIVLNTDRLVHIVPRIPGV